ADGYTALHRLSQHLSLFARPDYCLIGCNAFDQFCHSFNAEAVAGNVGEIPAPGMVPWPLPVDSRQSDSIACRVRVGGAHGLGSPSRGRCCDVRLELPEMLCADPG